MTRDAILTCARKPTWVSLIYRTLLRTNRRRRRGRCVGVGRIIVALLTRVLDDLGPHGVVALQVLHHRTADYGLGRRTTCTRTHASNSPASNCTATEHTHTHTHPLNGRLSGTTHVSRYQKGKNQSGFYWSKRQRVAVASAGPYASLHLAPDRQRRQNLTTQFSTHQMPFLLPNQQRQSTEGTMPSVLVPLVTDVYINVNAIVDST